VENLFINAAKGKYRFESSKGLLTVEDLFDCPLINRNQNGVSLDTIARGINAQLKATEDERFFCPTGRKDPVLEVKLEILQYVISERMNDLDRDLPPPAFISTSSWPRVL